MLTPREYERLAQSNFIAAPFKSGQPFSQCCGAFVGEQENRKSGTRHSPDWHRNGFFATQYRKNPVDTKEVPPERDWFIIPDKEQTILIDWSPTK